MSPGENAWSPLGASHCSVIASPRQTGGSSIRAIRGPAREGLPNVRRESRFPARGATDGAETARAGRVRLIAVTGASRSSAMPAGPNMSESGFPGYDLTSWWGVVVPAGTPRPIVDKLAGWIGQINATEETRKFLYNVATDVLTGTPDSMAALIKQDTERWGQFAKLAKIEPQ